MVHSGRAMQLSTEGNGNGNSHAGLQAFIKPAKRPVSDPAATGPIQESQVTFNTANDGKIVGTLLRLTRLAVHEMPGSGTSAELLSWAGIDAEHIAEAARHLVK